MFLKDISDATNHDKIDEDIEHLYLSSVDSS
jgi:hypothetical protein